MKSAKEVRKIAEDENVSREKKKTDLFLKSIPFIESRIIDSARSGDFSCDIYFEDINESLMHSKVPDEIINHIRDMGYDVTFIYNYWGAFHSGNGITIDWSDSIK